MNDARHLVLCVLVPLAISAVVLVYLLARRATLSPRDGLFVAMLTALSELFLPLAPTFMSDVPAFCFLLACRYGFTRAAEAAERAPARTAESVAWLVFGTLAALLDGHGRDRCVGPRPGNALGCVAAALSANDRHSQAVPAGPARVVR